MNIVFAQSCTFVCALTILSGCATFDLHETTLANSTPSTPATWKIKFDESGSNPVIANGYLYIGSADGAVYAIDSNTGETKWRFQTGENIKTGTSEIQATSLIDIFDAVNKKIIAGSRRVDMTPSVENGVVLIGSGDKSFYVIDAETGMKRWSYLAGLGMASFNTSTFHRPTSLIKNNTVHFVTEEGLHAMDVLTGKRKWLFETLQEIPIKQMKMNGDRKRTPSDPVMGDGMILLTAWLGGLGESKSLKSFVYAVDPESGKEKWVTSVDGLDITAPLTTTGLVFVAVTEPKVLPEFLSNHVTLYAINSTDGQIKWKADLERSFYGAPSLKVTNNLVYFSTNQNLVALDIETGRQIWNFSAETINRGISSNSSGLNADDKHLYVITHKESLVWPTDTIHALSLTSGQEVWSLTISDNLHIAFIHDGIIYANGKYLYAIEADKGKERWSFKHDSCKSARLISGDRIFLTSPTTEYVGSRQVEQGYLCAIDAKTGRLRQ